MLPLVVLRRLDCVLDPTEDAVLAEFERLQAAHAQEKAFPLLLTKIIDGDREQPAQGRLEIFPHLRREYAPPLVITFDTIIGRFSVTE